MRVLAIDTSSDIGTVALLEDGAVRAALSARVQHQHGETLLPHVEHVLGLGGASVASLDLLAVGLGPGSFTGVRIGVATAKGLALAHGTKLVGVRTSRVLARAACGALRLVAIDAKKDEVFAAAYRAGRDGALTLVREDWHGSPGEVATVLAAIVDGVPDAEVSVVGSALSAHADVLSAALPRAVLAPVALSAPSAVLLALEASERFVREGADDPDALTPVYVRGADAKLPG